MAQTSAIIPPFLLFLKVLEERITNVYYVFCTQEDVFGFFGKIYIFLCFLRTNLTQYSFRNFALF